MLNEIIEELQAKGFITIQWFQLKGKSTAVLSFVNMMATTQTYTPDRKQMNYLTLRYNRDGGCVL